MDLDRVRAAAKVTPGQVVRTIRRARPPPDEFAVRKGAFFSQKANNSPNRGKSGDGRRLPAPDAEPSPCQAVKVTITMILRFLAVGLCGGPGTTELGS